MRPPVLALTVVLAIAGCSNDRPALRLRRLQIPAVGADQRCGNPATEATTELPAQTYTLRLSFLRGSGQGASELTVGRYDLICDAIAPRGGTARELLLPQAEIARGGVVLRVEAFDGDDQQLVYSGQTRLEGDADEVSVYLQRVGSQSCFYGQRRPRAFHTATLLPNGQVLLLGGLTGSSTSSAVIDGGQLYADDSVEVFDPADLSVHLTVATTRLPPRAFHRALLLTSPRAGPYRLLLLGGLTGPSGSAPVAHLLLDLAKDPFLINPEASATAAATGILTYFPAASGQDARFEYTELPAPPAGFFPELVLSGDGATLLVVGGATAFTATGGAEAGFAALPGPQQAQWWTLPAPTAAANSLPELKRSVTLSPLRAGHAAARLPEGNVIVIGGAMDGDDATAEKSVAAIAPLGGGFDAAPLAGAALGAAWQTLTEIGLTDEERQQGKNPRALLWAGGFTLEARGETDAPRWRAAHTPSEKPLQLLRVVQDKLESSGAIDPQGGVVSSGYQSAVRLHDGSVLLSGGNANPATCGWPEGSASQTAYCPLAQLAIYQLDASGTGLVRQTRANAPALRLPRYGHQATRLLDLSVLFTGGLTLNAAGQPAVSGEAELLNPRNGSPSEDYLVNLPTGRPTAEAAIPCGLRRGR